MHANSGAVSLRAPQPLATVRAQKDKPDEQSKAIWTHFSEGKAQKITQLMLVLNSPTDLIPSAPISDNAAFEDCVNDHRVSWDSAGLEQVHSLLLRAVKRYRLLSPDLGSPSTSTRNQTKEQQVSLDSISQILTPGIEKALLVGILDRLEIVQTGWTPQSSQYPQNSVEQRVTDDVYNQWIVPLKKEAEGRTDLSTQDWARKFRSSLKATADKKAETPVVGLNNVIKSIVLAVEAAQVEKSVFCNFCVAALGWLWLCLETDDQRTEFCKYV